MSRYRISGVPVVKGDQLVGIITNRDLRFETDRTIRVADIMTKDNLITAPMGISLEESKRLLQKTGSKNCLLSMRQAASRGLSL